MTPLSVLTNVDLDHQGFLGLLGSPQKILVVSHLSSYCSPTFLNRSEETAPLWFTPALKSWNCLDIHLRASHAPFVFASQAELEDRPGEVGRWVREDQLARPSRVPHFAQWEECFGWRRRQPGLRPDAHGSRCYPFAGSIHHRRFVRCDISTRAIPLSAQSTLRHAHSTLRPLPFASVIPQCESERRGSRGHALGESDGKNGLSDALDWVSDVSGGDRLVVLAGSLCLVAGFYRFVEPGL